MRDIKFRGKRIDNGEWVYGFYYTRDWEDTHWIRCKKDFHFIDIQIYYESIGQFTGQLDKIGVEIYDGDIMMGKYKKIPKVVKYINACYHLVNPEGHCLRSYALSNSSATSMVVIGNVFEHSHLLNK